jgi:hypothetical protein
MLIMSNHKTIYLAVTVPAGEAEKALNLLQAHTDNLQIDGVWHQFYETTEAIQKEAQSIIYREYRDIVRGVAEEVIRAVRDGAVTDSSELYERITEECESACTYTADCVLIVAKSSNDGAYFEDRDASNLTGSNFWEMLAFPALRADVNEELSRSDEIDTNEDDLGWFACEDCENRFQRSAWESEEETDVCTGCIDKRLDAEAAADDEHEAGTK